jgi:hypothetical protein
VYQLPRHSAGLSRSPIQTPENVICGHIWRRRLILSARRVLVSRTKSWIKGRENLPHAYRRRCLKLVLPEAECFVSQIAQPNNRFFVTRSVACDLCSPEPGARLRKVTAFVTTVPEASIDENSETSIMKKEVRISWDRSWMKSPARYSVANQRISESSLCGSVSAASNSGHLSGPLLRDPHETGR